MPHVKGIQFLVWTCFVISVPLRIYTNYLSMAALVLGVLRHAGMPKFNMQYLQTAMFNENLQLIGVAACAAMLGGQNLIMYAPLVLHGFLIMSEIATSPRSPGPLSFLPQIGFIKAQFA